MKTATAKLAFVTVSALLLSCPAYAQESESDQNSNHVAIGAGFIDQYAPFNSAPAQTNLIPFVSIRQGAFYFEGVETGVQLESKAGGIAPSLGLFVIARSPGGQDRTKLTLDAGARLSFATRLGVVSGEIRHDATDHFNGTEVIFRYSYPHTFGRLTLVPSLQASWLDQKTANYMYGITAAQRARMIQKQRRVILPVAPITGEAWNLGGGVSLSYRLTDRIALVASANATHLDKSIRRSAAVEQSWEAQSGLGLTYRF